VNRLSWDRCYDFLNIFAEKFCKKLAFLAQNKAKLCKNRIITLVFEKNAIFFAENWRKSQKIVIITSTPVSRLFYRTLRSITYLDGTVKIRTSFFLQNSNRSIFRENAGHRPRRSGRPPNQLQGSQQRPGLLGQHRHCPARRLHVCR
jgi:hypothetical protein